MATDLAFDFAKHDYVIAPNNDLDIVSGQAVVDQRIRIRLFIPQGEWLLDPTGGNLGSRLRDVFSMKPQQALQSVKLLVREALAPMDDINVVDVQAQINPANQRAIDVTILYEMTGTGAGEAEVLSTQVTVG